MENVVNPPKNPEINKYLIFSEGDQCNAIISVNNPIRKQPTIFTNIMGKGIPPMTVLGNIFPIATRAIAPIAPPNPIVI